MAVDPPTHFWIFLGILEFFYFLKTPKNEAIEKGQLVWTFSTAEVIGVPFLVLKANGQGHPIPDYYSYYSVGITDVTSKKHLGSYMVKHVRFAVAVLTMSLTLFEIYSVTTWLENLEMSGDLEHVREMSGMLLTVRELSGKYQGKNLVMEKCPKTVHY